MKDKLENIFGNKGILCLSALLLIISFSSAGRYHPVNQDNNIRLMFYNVENLFDTLNCALEDDEFLPEALRRWNSFKYYRKLDNLSKVIISAGEWEPPAIIGLCEVENINVLSDLVNKTILKQRNYNYIYANSADKRGIGVALLYNNRFKPVYRETYYPVDENEDTLSTRSVLFVKLADKIDTLGIVVTHWPSRRGGVSVSDPLRACVARLIKERVISHNLSKEDNLKIIIMGDLNCEPGDDQVKCIIAAEPTPKTGYSTYVINLADDRNSTFGGSYKYQGRWYMYDQVLISNNLFNPDWGYIYCEDSFNVLNNNFLLTDDNSYKGLKPFSTWSGPRYNGGYSDHLPVIIDIRVKE